jgi:hypothetical protein
MWLDDARGHAIDWSTQRWVQLTGKRVSLDECPWLSGPVGKPSGIGPRFFETFAAESSLRLAAGRRCGLLPDFRRLAGPRFDPGAVAPAVAAFYERTSEYDMDVWAHWCGAFRPFGGLLAALFSRRLQQLNVPLSGLDTSRGMTSDVVPVIDPASGEPLFTAWVRRLAGTGDVIYAGAYSTCEVPHYDGRCVRVVFPLPNGNAIVIMRPTANADGSLSLVSAGRGFGDSGFYFTVRADQNVVWARCVRTMRETITVYPDADGVRADHVLTLWGITFLQMHYRLRRLSRLAASGL